MNWQNIARPTRLAHLSLDSRGYPVIATVSRSSEVVNFGSISERRKFALGAFDWCGVCGYPFGAEARWQVVITTPGGPTRPDEAGALYGEAPVHEVCLLYAAQVCPYLASPGARLGDDVRSGQRRDAVVRAVGYRHTSGVEPFESALQRGTFVLHFDQAEAIDEITYREPGELADRYTALLKDETVPPVRDGEGDLIRMFAELSDAGDIVTGAAVMIGGAFAPNVFRVQGCSIFDKDVYRTIAAMSLDSTQLPRLVGNEDPASSAAARWLLDHDGDIPTPLAHWRERGRQQVRYVDRQPRPIGPGRSVPRNAPCPCGSGRRAARCHPAGFTTGSDE